MCIECSNYHYKFNNQIDRVSIKMLNRSSSYLDMCQYKFLNQLCNKIQNYMWNISQMKNRYKWNRQNHIANIMKMMMHNIHFHIVVYMFLIFRYKNYQSYMMYISPIFTYNISQKYTSNIDYLYYMQSNFIHIHNNLIRENNILQHRQRSMFLKQNYNSKEQYYKSYMKYSNMKNMLDKKNRRLNKFRSWFQNNLQHIHLNKFLIQS